MVSELPRIFLLSSHLQPEKLHQLEDSIINLTYDVREANIIVGNITRRDRAMFELRRLKLETEPMEVGNCADTKRDGVLEPHPKRQRVLDMASTNNSPENLNQGNAGVDDTNIVVVLRLAWLTDSSEQGIALPTDRYLLYKGRKCPPSQFTNRQPETHSTYTTDAQNAKFESQRSWVSSSSKSSSPQRQKLSGAQSSRVIGDAASISSASLTPIDGGHYGRHPDFNKYSQSRARPPALIHQTTSEHDLASPPLPAFLNTTYSCQRPTPACSPNEDFAEELRAIRTLRLLQGDQIGVRAYSTSIAALAAYPYPIQKYQEIERLPGCGAKIAELYQKWRVAGHTDEIMLAEADPKLKVLKTFYNIWGVGDTTARDFYRKGWRDLDDVVEFGWDSLSRVQQIGIKYYDEFQLKIPRDEVESIANVILSHAHKVDTGFQMTIVGGYRRGKLQSGDVDVVLSHPDETKTLYMIERIVLRLEESRLITHTLSLWTRNSERGQVPLPWSGNNHRAGSGFDTLDKALVVWQSPEDSTGTGGDTTASKTKVQTDSTKAPHRRVDIIISPWKTVGCAVLGWSGGNTFQRDLRRYCKTEKGLKFDSSGIRSQADGRWVDLESYSSGVGPAPDMETAERRVFNGLGLPWRLPQERCTG